MRRAAAGALTAVLLAVAGCTADDTPSPEPSPTAKAPSPTATPEKVTLPEVRKGYRTAAQAGPRLANGGLGIVEFGKGVTWVGVYCRSEGRSPEKLSVVIDTIGEFTTVCPTGEVQHELHQLNLTEPFDGQVRIETADDVRWAANVQVSAPADS